MVLEISNMQCCIAGMWMFRAPGLTRSLFNSLAFRDMEVILHVYLSRIDITKTLFRWIWLCIHMYVHILIYLYMITLIFCICLIFASQIVPDFCQLHLTPVRGAITLFYIVVRTVMLQIRDLCYWPNYFCSHHCLILSAELSKCTKHFRCPIYSI